ncbi:MAG: ribonuclease P protein component [Robiginitomaculum sp.]|nr:ribonuclease P protein component [Robiginitomaculum sp.]
MSISRLTHHQQFLFVARGQRVARHRVVVQANKAWPEHERIRVGFTATKKTGNAVRRNRGKRRLRAGAAQVLSQFGVPGWDYVFIARKETADAPWQQLLGDMKAALRSLHVAKGRDKPTAPPKPTKLGKEE